MRLTSTTSGKCEIKTDPDNTDRVCDILEDAGFEASPIKDGTIIYGDNFDKEYNDKEIFDLFDRLEDYIENAEFTFSDFIVGEGNCDWYFKYENEKWYSGKEVKTVDYSEIKLPDSMNKEFRTVSNIMWSPDVEILMEQLENVSEEKAAKAMEIPLDHYKNMTYSERLDYLYDMLRHGRASDYMLTEVLDMPDTVVLPKEVVKEAIEDHDTEVISEYLSDKYGFFHEGFTLSEELEAEIGGKERE